jgi:hypothetical protein
MAQGNTYRFISDGGHGWAEIPTTDGRVPKARGCE